MIPGNFSTSFIEKGVSMEQYYLGGDVSKGYSDFVILDNKKQRVEENFQLDDTIAGHSLLYDRLRSFFEEHPDAELCAAVESTGGYENNWYNTLRKFQSSFNIKTARLNPAGVCKNTEAGLKRIITDKISAQSVAEYLITHPEKVMYQQQDYWASLRKQWSFIRMLTKQSTQLFNQLESLLYSANPEILKYCQEGVPAWILKLLRQYPTAAKLARAKVSVVSRIPYVSTSRAKELVASAKATVASASDSVTAQLISATVNQIQHIQKTITAQIKIMTEECTTPEVELLKTFTGIGDYSAIGLMLEIQAVERFPTAKKLASFFGLHPVFKISGDGVGAVRMSKRGRREPRRILFMVAMTAIVSNSLIRDLYQKHVAKGMEKMAAIGLCMHKILRIIYGMLKSNTPFNPEIDLMNREKTADQPQKERMDKSRRYQGFDADAPISRRQRKKREERKLSQNAVSVECEICTPVLSEPSS
jgi:transposase